ncbi:peptidase U32 family protein [Propionivibrio sp.]|uniref:peptidase U32 family protein n=1 Tax=Propionivibrio sp. TaxID=2212460 RepID=UPI0039E51B89
MPADPLSLELLAPARNADFGIEAINHGADAVYIGGPAFGARADAGNAVAEIARLAGYAHRFGARVLVALNTILRDDELDVARTLAHQIHDAGADALIVQDMGLLELDLPPIQLHASTQCDIRTPQKARFLADAGFSQMVLARELSLDAIRAIAARTAATLEFFVHGALCVSYSGQCYLSHARTGRSANRGECAQPCRLPYDLADAHGQTLARGRHLLSLRDNEQTDNLAALINAGIRSFKIEGRLKDLAYVKNVTAHYRRRLDAIIESSSGRYGRSSSGRCAFLFEPRPEKTFNRGATDYFVRGRHADVGAFDSPKFVGERVGEIRRVARDSFDVATALTLGNGDGLTYFDAAGALAGLRVNLAERVPDGYRLFPALENGGLPPGLNAGSVVYRNHDQAFIRLLEKKSAERRIPVRLRLGETADGFELTLADERGVAVTVPLAHARETARDPERAPDALRENLGKLGGTIYAAESIELALSAPWFIPASALNALRRAAVAALDAARAKAWRRPPRRPAAEPPTPYPDDALSYLGNVYNRQARAFYARHGVKVIAPAYECGGEQGEVPLMVTKHCLRYSFDLCPKQTRGIRPDPLLLISGKDRLTLRFDCKRCEMQVVGSARRK